MNKTICFPRAGLLALLLATGTMPAAAAQSDSRVVKLDEATRRKCLEVLRQGMRGDQFWPSIHAAEGLTLGGYGVEVRRFLQPKLATQSDDQMRCGIARELVRAGDRPKAAVMLRILAGEDDHGHVHAAESLYKVGEIGNGVAMRRAFEQTGNLRLRLMAAGALARCGNPTAMQFLREMLKHDDPQFYMVAAWILGRIGDNADIARIQDNLTRDADELARAYHEHALAALGDANGRRALAENLGSEDPAVRTYAATFAGDARATAVAGQLQSMLDDPHLDARIRAAQTLLVLNRPPHPNPREDVSELVYQAGARHPRYTEGSVVQLNDGSLLYATTEFQGSGSDFAQARIVARVSQDAGRTWGPQRVLQENTGGQNVMSVTLRRLQTAPPPGKIALFYLEKNSYDDLDLLARFSDDEAASFGAAVRITNDPGYHVVNNDRITQLSTGRLLAPAASTEDVRKVNHFVSHCYLSDDAGRTWRKGQGEVDLPRRGAMEPEVVELNDGRVIMIMRTQLGYIAKSYSKDGGDTWSEPGRLGDLQAPEAPATLRRIPSTGDLLLLWNNTYTPGAGHGGRRTPLTAAISSDDGQTWRMVGDLETDRQSTYSYPSLTFVGPRAVMTYWESDAERGRLSSRFRSLPIHWFYTGSKRTTDN